MAQPDAPPSPLIDFHRAAGASVAAWPPAADTDDSEDAGRVELALEYPSGSLWPDSGVICTDLSHLPAFTLEGEDVRRWTNGMFTNNTRRLQPGQGNRHCACDDRGRVRGVLDLYLIENSLVQIVLDGMTDAAFQARYQMYLMLDDIEVDHGEPRRVVLTVQGEGTEGVLAELGLPLPPADHAHALSIGARPGIRVCRRDRTGHGGVDLLVPEPQVSELWGALQAAGAAPRGVGQLDALRIVAVQAAFPTDATDKSMVHELRLNTSCCAFDKGCYVGQEVINRIDVKGAIQKRLTGLVLDAPVPVGSEVHLADRRIGYLTSRATVEGTELGLGVLRKTAWEPGTEVAVVGTDGQRVRATVAEAPLLSLGG